MRMKLLVLGGTVFLGRHVGAAALADGHAVSIFHRGVSEPAAIDGVETLIGDRDGDVAALAGRRFDAVIDCSGYTAAQATRTGDVLAPNIGRYVFVSTRSVYRDLGPLADQHEDAPRLAGHDGYGAAKARAEEALEASMPGRVTIVRPGLIGGPHDPTGRFTYWPLRVRRGGDVLAPGRPARPVQCVDARDVARWCVSLAAQTIVGTYDVVGPCMTMGALLERMHAVIGGDARFHWIPDDWLLAHDVAAWTGLPLWLPDADADFGGLMRGADARARGAGLVLRSIDETIRDTLAWAVRPDAKTPRAVATLTPEREQVLLTAWAARAMAGAP